MVTVYFDWNVFNKIEKVPTLNTSEKELYRSIEDLITSQVIRVPYSNAHISDLHRGYLKNQTFVSGHIEKIRSITQNLCIVQYWGENVVKWHYRDPLEFLDSLIEESKQTASSFSSLFAFSDDPLIKMSWDLRKTSLELHPVDESFGNLYVASPIFDSIFPRTKTEMNMLAMCEDLYEFSFKLKTDYTLYRSFKKFLTESKTRFPMHQSLFDGPPFKATEAPKYLALDEMLQNRKPKGTKRANPDYDKIINLFLTIDLEGYRQDDKFANLIDDALHVFYGAHCNFFITIDKKCADKAKVVYEQLNITSQVATPNDLVSIITNDYAQQH